MNADITIKTFKDLLATVQTLRGPQGCPWDRKQTTETMRNHLLEECEEAVRAIDAKDTLNLCEELGDVLYLIVMISLINTENESFTLDDVVQGINEKLIRRHPHVFANISLHEEEDLHKQWDRIKRSEKQDKKID